MRKLTSKITISLVTVFLSIAAPIAYANPVFNWSRKNSNDQFEEKYTKGELLIHMEEQEGEEFSDKKLKETMDKYNINVLNAKFFKDIGAVYYNHENETFELTVTTDLYKATLNAYIMGLDVDPDTWGLMLLAFSTISETITTDMGNNYKFGIIRPNNEDLVLIYSDGEIIENNMNSGDEFVNVIPTYDGLK